MGKRSSFPRRKNDAYYTPYEAVVPLIPHLQDVRGYVEPCAGDGALIRHLATHGLQCHYACDIDPQPNQSLNIIEKSCAFDLKSSFGASHIITNPVWSRDLLHLMIWHFMNIAPTWLLFDAAWKYTEQKRLAKRIGCKTVPDLLWHCKKIVPVGRVRWIEGSEDKGMDDCAWYLFDIKHEGFPVFTPDREVA